MGARTKVGPQSLAAVLLLSATAAAGGEQWIEFRSAPFQVVTNAGETAGRDATNELAQLGYTLGSIIGKQDLKSTWPIRFVITKARTPYFPIPKLARDSYVGAAPALTPETRQAVVELLLEANAGRMPDWIEKGLVEVLSTFKAEATHLTLGIPPAHRDRDWARVQMLTTRPQFAGRLRVLIYNLQQGVDPEPAYKNAFGMTAPEIEKELDKYIAAGVYEPSHPLGKPLNPKRDLIPKDIDSKVADLTLTDVLAANGDTAAKVRYRDFPGAMDAPALILEKARAEKDPTAAKALFEQAAKTNPMWADPYWYESQIEDNPARKVMLLKKATELAPRHTEYWLALANAQEAVRQYSEALKSWSAAERSAGTEQERERIRAARLEGEEKRADLIREQKEEEKRKSGAEVEALRQKMIENIRAAEMKANAGKEPIDTSKLEEYRENMGYSNTSGILQRVDCFTGQAVLHIATGDGIVKLHVANPKKVAITGEGEHAVACGAQKPARQMKAEYLEKKDAKLGTIGEVTNIEFR